MRVSIVCRRGKSRSGTMSKWRKDVIPFGLEIQIKSVVGWAAEIGIHLFGGRRCHPKCSSHHWTTRRCLKEFARSCSSGWSSHSLACRIVEIDFLHYRHILILFLLFFFLFFHFTFYILQNFGSHVENANLPSYFVIWFCYFFSFFVPPDCNEIQSVGLMVFDRY